MALMMPSSGLSMICQTKVTATTGATYGNSIDARTRVRPLNGLRTTRAAISPRAIDSTVPTTL
jgi:hypothetical protein